jgi:hypothetical protein
MSRRSVIPATLPFAAWLMLGYWAPGWLFCTLVVISLSYSTISLFRSAGTLGFLDIMVLVASILLILTAVGFDLWSRFVQRPIDIETGSIAIAILSFLMLAAGAIELRRRMTPQQYAAYNTQKNASGIFSNSVNSVKNQK